MGESYENRGLWTPPSPFVTHEQLGPIHSRIGSLEKGQEHILQTYSHLRGEMLQNFDELKRIVLRPPPEPERGIVNLTMRELVIIAVALVIAGAFLGRIGLDRLVGA